MKTLNSLEMAKLSPASFAMMASQGQWKLAKHLSLINRKLMKAARGNARLIINLGPRMGKSEFISKYFPAWFLGTFPDKKIILAGYEADFAAGWGRSARDLMEEHGKELWGLELDPAANAASRWKLKNHNGAMYSIGAAGAILGKGADVFIIDDPIKNLLSVNTPLPTPSGWKNIGDIVVGDIIYDHAGEETKVTHVSDRRKDKCYRVHFSDSSYIDAHPGHLWTLFSREDHSVYTQKNKVYNTNWWQWKSKGIATVRTVDTQEIMSKPVNYRNMTNWVVPNTLPLYTTEKELSIDPYIFGLWLGDGTTTAPVLTAHKDDAQHYQKYILNKNLDARIHTRKDKPNTVSISMSLNVGGDPPSHIADSMAKRLKATLIDETKHIPDIYLRGSYNQRLALLKGLMDTDGTIASGQVVFCNTNKNIIDGVYELFVSLGAKATIKEKYNDYGVYWLVVSCPIFCPFDLPRKVDTWIKDTDKSSIRRLNRTIDRVEIIDEEIEYVCIRVDTPSKLFLAGKAMIPTHNSEDANSSLFREKLWQWYGSTAYTRLQPDASMIIIHQRFHYDDLTGRILAEMSRGGEKYEYISLPSIALEDELIESEGGIWPDKLGGRKKGESLWPEMWPVEKLNRIKHSGAMSSYLWAALHDQNPAPAEGGMFKEPWFKYAQYKNGYYYLIKNRDSDNVELFDEKDCWKFITADVANKAGKINDYSVIAVWAVTPKNDLILQHIERDHFGYEQVLKKLIFLNGQFKPRFVGIENTGIAIQMIVEARNKGLAVRALEPEGQGKQNRANSPLGAVVRMESGKIYFLKGITHLSDFEQELLYFPMGKNDDCVDCLSYACNELTKVSGMMSGNFVPYSVSDVITRAGSMKNLWQFGDSGYNF